MRQQAGYAMLLFVLCTLSLSANHVDEYIQNYKDIAQREMRRSGIPASIIIAQGIHESSWGRGKLAINSNNHFGIKCKDYWTGPTYYIEDDDYENGQLIKSCFRAYEGVEASYIDHTNFLIDSERYKELFSYGRTDYINWAKGLKRCGYATDPNYAEKLTRIIEKHQLHVFDIIIDVFVMEAPSFHIPAQFLNSETIVDPVVYTYEEDQTQESLVVYENNYVDEAADFDYEVPIENLPEKEEESLIVQEDPIYIEREELRVDSYNNYEYDMTDVIPNTSSRDKKIQNLSRKPRASSATGPR